MAVGYDNWKLQGSDEGHDCYEAQCARCGNWAICAMVGDDFICEECYEARLTELEAKERARKQENKWWCEALKRMENPVTPSEWLERAKEKG